MNKISLDTATNNAIYCGVKFLKQEKNIKGQKLMIPIKYKYTCTGYHKSISTSRYFPAIVNTTILDV